MDSLTSILSFSLFLYMEKLHSFSILCLMLIPQPVLHSPSTPSASVFLWNLRLNLCSFWILNILPPTHSFHLQWNMLLNVLLKQKPLTCISYFCFICLLPFSDKLIETDAMILACLPLPLTHFHIHSRLTCASSLLLRNCSCQGLRWPPSEIFWSLFFFEPSVAFDIFLTTPHQAIHACWYTIFLWFLFYFHSRVFSFSFCWIIGIAPGSYAFPFNWLSSGIFSTFTVTVIIYMLMSFKFLLPF